MGQTKRDDDSRLFFMIGSGRSVVAGRQTREKSRETGKVKFKTEIVFAKMRIGDILVSLTEGDIVSKGYSLVEETRTLLL